jgi:2-C-methyl-D-erythritol 4-phosphate cytidylyltransferase
VSYTVGGTATAGSDYAALSGSVTIPAGTASATITVTAVNDTLVEGDETVVVTLGASAAYTVGSPSSGTVTIVSDDGLATTISIVATTATAMEAGPGAGVFTVTRSGSTAGVLSVLFSVSGTATPGGDYVNLPASVAIPAGAASATITVTPVNDTLVEGNETVVVTLSPSAAYTVGSPGSATVTIVSDDVVPTVTVTATTATATEAGPTAGQFRVTRTGNTAAALTVNWSVGGTAASGSDYNSLPGSVTIPVGAASATVAVTPANDTLVEGNETVVVTLSPSAAYTVGSPSSATVTIVSDDVLPTVTVVATTPTATEAGPTPGRFTVTRSGSTAGVLSVLFSVSGTATPGGDYVNLPGSVAIPAGAASATITVTPVNDTLVEGDETVVVTLSASAAYTVGSPGSATVTIVSDDGAAAPAVTITATTATATEAGPTAGQFRVTRTGSTAAALTVSYTVGGTATAGSDYAALPGSVTIPAGAGSATITVTPTNDTLAEADETVVVTLSAGAGYTVGAPATATVTLVSDEALAKVKIHRNRRGPKAEPGTFTVSRQGGGTEALTVQYVVSGSAVMPRDYAPVSGSVTIPAGSKKAAITINPTSGAAMAGDETVVLTLGPGAGYTVGGPAMAVAVIREGTLVPGVFLDVPEGYWAEDWVEALYTDDVTMGCGMVPPLYCPDAPVTRAQMAIFLLRAKHGEAYLPPDAQGRFADVPASHWAAAWIEALVAEGITAGCGEAQYCPEQLVTRAQMAVFLIRATRGTGGVPVAGGLFGDVPASHWAAAWIEELVRLGVTAGCGAGVYCPEQPVTRAQMAVFLIRAFELPD